jgi:hypothetical protein
MTIYTCLLSELRAQAEAQGKTIDELAEQAIRVGLKERSWQELLAYGHERGGLAASPRKKCRKSRPPFLNTPVTKETTAYQISWRGRAV